MAKSRISKPKSTSVTVDMSINGDGGFMYTANELATAVRHRIPLVAVVFADV
jgi:thiamine pyrophosphate-dependent acetolactate synthase large subunit-like protein